MSLNSKFLFVVGYVHSPEAVFLSAVKTPVKYPVIDIDIDRTRAAQLGVTLSDVSRSLIASTSSSRYTEKNVWIDQKSNQSYSVQVEIPENRMASINDITEIPVLSNQSRPVLGDLAVIRKDTSYGENDNMGVIPYLSVTANLNDKDLGAAADDVEAINDLETSESVTPSCAALVRSMSISITGYLTGCASCTSRK